jgi:hypothetical protein
MAIRRRAPYLAVLSTTLLIAAAAGVAAANDQSQLLFREDWAESPAEMPVGQKHVVNPELALATYGPGLHGIKKSHHDWIKDDPWYIWSGACPGNWAVTLRHKRGPLNLSGPAARIRWRSKQAGFRQLRIILKLEGGAWLVSDAFDGPSSEWRETEFRLSEIRWRGLDIARISETNWAPKVNLSRVAEVGFTDLMPGGLSDACSRLDWIEVYGAPRSGAGN